MSARQIVATLFSRRWLLLSLLLVPVALSLFAYVLTPASYRATAKVLIRLGRESAPRDDLGQNQSMASLPQSTKQEILNSELEIVKSRELSDQLIQEIGPASLFPPSHSAGGRGAPGKTLRSGNACSTASTPHKPQPLVPAN